MLRAGVGGGVSRIRYREGYGYVLHDDYTVKTSLRPAQFIHTDFLRLDTDGNLYIKAGFAWDGPSGPAFDTPNFMRASLVHDASYFLIRNGYLPLAWREKADDDMYRLCREDGMSAIRAWWCYQGVRIGGESSATEPKEVLTAP